MLLVPLKQLALVVQVKKVGPFIDSLNHRSYTKAYVSSETDIPFYAEAFGIREENVVPTGTMY